MISVTFIENERDLLNYSAEAVPNFTIGGTLFLRRINHDGEKDLPLNKYVINDIHISIEQFSIPNREITESNPFPTKIKTVQEMDIYVLKAE